MTTHDLSKTLIAFDLDDTLYPEADYQISGLRAVIKCVEELYGKSIDAEFLGSQFDKREDHLKKICQLAGLPLCLKESLLWYYRLHKPEIFLSEAVREAVANLEKLCLGVVVLTDGRSISQRLKLKALGLAHLNCYISEEYSSAKPELLRFEKIMCDYTAERYIYIGDNPKKDFFAPKSLGWYTIGVSANGRNIHSQEIDGLSDGYLPDVWIQRIEELWTKLC